MHLGTLSLRDLDYALALQREGNFRRAAHACGVSQPSLSEQIRKLEATLGTPLFERMPRGVRPTPQGEKLLERAARVLAEARALLEAAQGTARLGSELRLGVIASLGPYYVPHLLPLLRSQVPETTPRLVEGQTDALLQDLVAGTLDAVLLATALPHGSGLVSTPLFFEPFWLACPAGHRLATAPLPSLTGLASDDLILLDEGHCLREQALSLCRTGLPGTRHATSVETLWQMIAAGEGFSLLPALSLAGRQPLAPLLEIRPLPGEATGRSIALAWRASDPRGPDYQALAALLAAQHPPGTHPIGASRG